MSRNPSGLWLMKARILSIPAGSIRGAMSTSTSAVGVDMVLPDGHQAGAATHGRPDEDGSATPDGGQQADQVGHHGVLGVEPFGRPVRVPVAPGIEGDGVVAGRPQSFPGAFPGMSGLAAAVLENHERAGGITPRVTRKRQRRQIPASDASDRELKEVACLRSFTAPCPVGCHPAEQARASHATVCLLSHLATMSARATPGAPIHRTALRNC